jgi:hypothetical protein
MGGRIAAVVIVGGVEGNVAAQLGSDPAANGEPETGVNTPSVAIRYPKTVPE